MIRCAKIDDIPSIVKIEKKVFKETLGENFLFQEINDNPLAEYYVYELGHEVIGYIGFRIDLEFAEMMNFCVAPFHQGEGYGSELLSCGIDEMIKKGARTITLEVRESNKRAQHVYEKLGFKQSHVRKNYYKKEDAFVFIKEVQV